MNMQRAQSAIAASAKALERLCWDMSHPQEPREIKRETPAAKAGAPNMGTERESIDTYLRIR